MIELVLQIRSIGAQNFIHFCLKCKILPVYALNLEVQQCSLELNKPTTERIPMPEKVNWRTNTSKRLFYCRPFKTHFLISEVENHNCDIYKVIIKKARQNHFPRLAESGKLLLNLCHIFSYEMTKKKHKNLTT